MKNMIWAAYFVAIGWYIARSELDLQVIEQAGEWYGQLVRRTADIAAGKDDPAPRRHRHEVRCDCGWPAAGHGLLGQAAREAEAHA